MILAKLKDDKDLIKINDAYDEIIKAGNMKEFISMALHPVNQDTPEWEVIKQALRLEKGNA